MTQIYQKKKMIYMDLNQMENAKSMTQNYQRMKTSHINLVKRNQAKLTHNSILYALNQMMILGANSQIRIINLKNVSKLYRKK
jgi:hypothetical protein